MSLRFLKAKPKLGLSKNHKVRPAQNSNKKNDESETNSIELSHEKQSGINNTENQIINTSQTAVPRENTCIPSNRKDKDTDNENTTCQITELPPSCERMKYFLENGSSKVVRSHSIEEDRKNSIDQDQSGMVNHQKCKTNDIQDNLISEKDEPNNNPFDNTDPSKEAASVVKSVEKNSDIKSTEMNNKTKINKFRFLKVKPKIQFNLPTKSRSSQPNKNTLNNSAEPIKNKTDGMVSLSNNDIETEKKTACIASDDDNGSIVGNEESKRKYPIIDSTFPTILEKNTTESQCSTDKMDDISAANSPSHVNLKLCTSIMSENSEFRQNTDRSLRSNKDLRHSKTSHDKIFPVTEENKSPAKVKSDDKCHRETVLQTDNAPTKSLTAYIKQLENKKFLSRSEKSNLLENETRSKSNKLDSQKKVSAIEDSKKHPSKANAVFSESLKNNSKRNEITDIKCSRSNKKISHQKDIIPTNKNDQKNKIEFEHKFSTNYQNRSKAILTKENIDSVPIFIDKTNEITTVAIDSTLNEKSYEHYLFDHMYAKKVNVPYVKRKNCSSESTTATKRKRKKRCHVKENNKSLEVDNAFTRALKLQNQKDNEEMKSSEEESEYDSEPSVDINIRTFEGIEHQDSENGRLLNEISIMFKEKNSSDFSGLSLVTKLIKEEYYDPAEHLDEFRAIQYSGYDTIETSNHLEQHEESMILTDNIIDLDEKPMSEVVRRGKNVICNNDDPPFDLIKEDCEKKKKKKKSRKYGKSEEEVKPIDSYESSDSEIMEIDEQDYLLYRKKPVTKKKNSENMFSKKQSETLKKLKMESSWKENLTVHDLMFYNPSSEPMSTPPDSWKPKEEVFENLKEEDEEAVDNPAPGPKLIIVNGKLVVDTNSLVIEETGLKKSKKKLAQSEAIIESSYSVKQCGDIYRRKKHLASKGNVEWSPEDTLMFYRALSVIGTDFTMMNTMFINRTRAAIKRKFKQEEKKNPSLLLKALTNYSNAFDMEELKRELDEDRKRAEKVKAMDKKKPKREKKEKSKEKRLMGTSYGKIIKKCLLGEGPLSSQICETIV